MDAGRLLAAIPIVLLIVVGAAAVAAYFRANLSEETIKTLTESNAAYRERITILEAEHVATTAKCEAIERDNQALRAQPSVAWHKLSNALDHHHSTITEETRQLSDRITGGFTDLGQRVDSVKHDVGDVKSLVGDHRRRGA